MVDYRRIRTGPRSRNRIEPMHVLALHRATRAFLDDALPGRISAQPRS